MKRIIILVIITIMNIFPVISDAAQNINTKEAPCIIVKKLDSENISTKMRVNFIITNRCQANIRFMKITVALYDENKNIIGADTMVITDLFQNGFTTEHLYFPILNNIKFYDYSVSEIKIY